MDLNNMLNLLNQSTNKQQPQPQNYQNNTPKQKLYPELLDIQCTAQQNNSIFPNDIHNTSTNNAPTATNPQPTPTPQNTQSNGFNLPFNLNPDTLKMIQQILPLLTNSGNENNILSSILGGSNPLGALFGSNKKSSSSTTTQAVESEPQEINIDDLIRIDDF